MQGHGAGGLSTAGMGVHHHSPGLQPFWTKEESHIPQTESLEPVLLPGSKQDCTAQEQDAQRSDLGQERLQRPALQSAPACGGRSKPAADLSCCKHPTCSALPTQQPLSPRSGHHPQSWFPSSSSGTAKRQPQLQTPAPAQQAPSVPATLPQANPPAKPPSHTKGKHGHFPPSHPSPARLSLSHPLLGGAETQRPERTVLFPSPDFPSAHAVGLQPANETETG